MPVEKRDRYDRKNPHPELVSAERFLRQESIDVQLFTGELDQFRNVFALVDRVILDDAGNIRSTLSPELAQIQLQNLARVEQMILRVETTPEKFIDENVQPEDGEDRTAMIERLVELSLGFIETYRVSIQDYLKTQVAVQAQEAPEAKEDPVEVQNAKRIADEMREANDQLEGFFATTSPDITTVAFTGLYAGSNNKLKEAKRQIQILEDEGLTATEIRLVGLLNGQIGRFGRVVKEKYAPLLLNNWRTTFHGTADYREVGTLQTDVAKHGLTKPEIAVLRTRTDKVIVNLTAYRGKVPAEIQSDAQQEVDTRIGVARDLVPTLDQLDFDRETDILRKWVEMILSRTDEDMRRFALRALYRDLNFLQRYALDAKAKARLPATDPTRISPELLSEVPVSEAEESLRRAIQALESDESSKDVLIEEYRKKSLTDLLGVYQTLSVQKGTAEEIGLRKVIDEKLKEFESLLPKDFYANLEILINDFWGLIDFGIFAVSSMVAGQLTCVHSEMLKSGAKTGAMDLNGRFNLNPLVMSDELNREWYSPHMGIIQKIVYAGFQEMKKPANRTRFSRSGPFSTDQAKALIEHVSGLNDFENFAGSIDGLNIKAELDVLPPEVQKLIKWIAVLKLSRDDGGYEAALYHLGKDKKALKLSGGGATMPDGFIPSVVYQVGKNSDRSNHAALLEFMDPTGTELCADWDEQDVNVYLMMVKINDTNDIWFHPGYSKLKHFKRYRPRHFDQDCPRMSHLMNQCGEGIHPVNEYSDPETGNATKQALMQIVSNAIGSKNFEIPPDTNQMTHVLEKAVKDMTSQIAKAFAYIGNNNAYPGDTPKQTRLRLEFAPIHEFILRATQYYLINLVINIPGSVSQLFSGTRDQEYYQLLDKAIATINKALKDNTSLKGYYWDNLVDNNFLLDNRDILSRHPRIERDIRNQFYTKKRERLVLPNGHVTSRDPEYADLPTEGRYQALQSAVNFPYHVDPSAWKPSKN